MVALFGLWAAPAAGQCPRVTIKVDNDIAGSPENPVSGNVSGRCAVGAAGRALGGWPWAVLLVLALIRRKTSP